MVYFGVFFCNILEVLFFRFYLEFSDNVCKFVVVFFVNVDVVIVRCFLVFFNGLYLFRIDISILVGEFDSVYE